MKIAPRMKGPPSSSQSKTLSGSMVCIGLRPLRLSSTEKAPTCWICAMSATLWGSFPPSARQRGAVSCYLLAGLWVASGWFLGGFWVASGLAPGRLVLGGFWVAPGWVLAGPWLGPGWVLPGSWLGPGWVLAGPWPGPGRVLTALESKQLQRVDQSPG